VTNAKSRFQQVAASLLSSLAILLLAGWVLARGPCHDRDRSSPWYVPAYAKLQTGGYLGAVTAGGGYSPWQLLDVGVFYGWVPPSLGGVSIHSFALRLGASVRGACIARDWNWVYFTGGVGVLVTPGDGFFLSVADRYHDSWRRSARRWATASAFVSSVYRSDHRSRCAVAAKPEHDGGETSSQAE
jgi:hypothetical protein